MDQILQFVYKNLTYIVSFVLFLFFSAFILFFEHKKGKRIKKTTGILLISFPIFLFILEIVLKTLNHLINNQGLPIEEIAKKEITLEKPIINPEEGDCRIKNILFYLKNEGIYKGKPLYIVLGEVSPKNRNIFLPHFWLTTDYKNPDKYANIIDKTTAASGKGTVDIHKVIYKPHRIYRVNMETCEIIPIKYFFVFKPNISFNETPGGTKWMKNACKTFKKIENKNN